jgi:peptidoglycan hydrolase-like protein with peptidoglycan-binding domain
MSRLTSNRVAKSDAGESGSRSARARTLQPHASREPVLARSLGNRGVQHLLRAGLLQPKLTISHPNDVYEQEAERVADEVMRMPEPAVDRGGHTSRRAVAIQRSCPACEDALQRQPLEEEELQAKPTAEALWDQGGDPETALPGPSVKEAARNTGGQSQGWLQAMWSTGQTEPLEPVWFAGVQSLPGAGQRGLQCHQTVADGAQTEAAGPEIESAVSELRQGGVTLPSQEREFFEPRFSASFAHVRIHADERADRVARAIRAEAFAVGSHIGFRANRYAPGSELGRRLLAHELTHVVQQTGGTPLSEPAVQRTIGDGHDLASTRFAGNRTLEAAFDDELLIRRGAKGEPVRLIQESLVAMGYALPQSMSRALPGRMDGDFGPETEAAVTRFQRDAGAVRIDGIVGPETMDLLDRHDVSRPAARPPQITGPVAPPLGGGACDVPFTGVTFGLANQVAAGVANPAVIGPAMVGGNPFLLMRGVTPITYTPEVTINAPDDATARQFRVGFVQNLLSSHRVADYSSGGTVATVVPTIPIKDGDPNDYHPIFVTNPHAQIVEDFGAAGATVALRWPDVPGDGAFINLNDNPSCAGAGLPAQTMTRMTMRDTFRLWTVVQHRQSGCVRSLHHVDWDLNWSATVAAAGAVAVTSNVNNVTEPNGNGAPRFIQGGDVPGAVAFKACI